MPSQGLIVSIGSVLVAVVYLAYWIGWTIGEQYGRRDSYRRGFEAGELIGRNGTEREHRAAPPGLVRRVDGIEEEGW